LTYHHTGAAGNGLPAPVPINQVELTDNFFNLSKIKTMQAVTIPFGFNKSDKAFFQRGGFTR